MKNNVIIIPAELHRKLKTIGKKAGMKIGFMASVAITQFIDTNSHLLTGEKKQEEK